MIRRFRVGWIALLTWAALSLASGCLESTSPALLTVTSVESPAGVDSGEPYLSVSGDTVLMSWLGRSQEGARQLLFATYVDGSWERPRVIAERQRMLVNVADFPSVTRGPDGTLWSHWLERDAEGFGYGVRVTRSRDGGATWGEPWTPHGDGTPTEHGFVAPVPLEVGMGFVWLDGRAFAATDAAGPRTETALYFRIADDGGFGDAELSLDPRVCDCCQTDVAVASNGPVLVYRDRSPEEIRDIRILRYEDGAWVDGGLVHEDGWETGACPINGPAVAAIGERVAVAWFTAAQGESRVQVALSRDGGRTFGDPTRVDDGTPAGRVDVGLLGDGSAVVSWLERTGGEGTEVRVRRIGSRGERLESSSATAAYTTRATGFGRLAVVGGDTILLAWTDGAELTPRVRVTRIVVEES